MPEYQEAFASAFADEMTKRQQTIDNRTQQVVLVAKKVLSNSLEDRSNRLNKIEQEMQLAVNSERSRLDKIEERVDNRAIG